MLIFQEYMKSIEACLKNIMKCELDAYHYVKYDAHGIIWQQTMADQFKSIETWKTRKMHFCLKAKERHFLKGVVCVLGNFTEKEFVPFFYFCN